MTPTKRPLVSVGVPLYNEEGNLASLLDSILRSSYEPIEIIVSDNGSNDRTWEIVQAYAAQHTVFKVFRQERNRGALFNFEFVLAKATGKYFAWAGGHDVWGPDFLAECVELLETANNVALVAPRTMWIDVDGNELRKQHPTVSTVGASSPAGRVERLLASFSKATAIYGVHRRSILDKTVPWPRVLGPDGIALARIARHGQIVPIDSTWFGRRLRSNETGPEANRRRLDQLPIRGIAFRFAFTSYYVLLFLELVKASGSPVERLRVARGYAKILSRNRAVKRFVKEFLSLVLHIHS